MIWLSLDEFMCNYDQHSFEKWLEMLSKHPNRITDQKFASQRACRRLDISTLPDTVTSHPESQAPKINASMLGKDWNIGVAAQRDVLDAVRLGILA